jgi:uncharacterized protein YbgA (DUF1722 family)/uncharacterized protein YbbK (DUF523 family)
MKLEDIAGHDPTIAPEELRIGVSACLLGNQVRYDGGHQRDAFITGTLSTFVEFVPVCPEVEMGLGVPRETLRLEKDGEETRLVAPASGTDHTGRMATFARQRVEALEAEDLSGFILKKNSPSCGLFRVKRYAATGMPEKNGRGFFAAALKERFPLLPIEEDGRLNDPVLRESFIERAFAYRRLQRTFKPGWKRGELVAHHTREKLLLMAHAPEAYRKLGRLIGEMDRHDPEDLSREYIEGFMQALEEEATRQRHTNVLQHMLGFFKRDLDAETRRELANHVEDYRQGIVPLLVPLALMRHQVRALDVKWLARQSYLEPQPNELMLRTYVPTASRKKRSRDPRSDT